MRDGIGYVSGRHSSGTILDVSATHVRWFRDEDSTEYSTDLERVQYIREGGVMTWSRSRDYTLNRY